MFEPDREGSSTLVRAFRGGPIDYDLPPHGESSATSMLEHESAVSSSMFTSNAREMIGGGVMPLLQTLELAYDRADFPPGLERIRQFVNTPPMGMH